MSRVATEESFAAPRLMRAGNDLPRPLGLLPNVTPSGLCRKVFRRTALCRGITCVTDEITNQVCSRAALARVCRGPERTRAKAARLHTGLRRFRLLSVKCVVPLRQDVQKPCDISPSGCRSATDPFSRGYT